MTEISHLETRLSEALERLRGAIAARAAAERAPAEDTGTLHERIAELEEENRELHAELAHLRAKREKDVAALDELITQLKPLIEEV
jgi:uncharacterized coiled-coil DUF342 family protein